MWDTANALLGERDVGRPPWVRQPLALIRTGQTSPLIATLEQEASAQGRTSSQVAALRTTAGS